MEALARINCLLKPGGVLFLGFGNGVDHVNINNHRIYGKYRMSLILPLWKPLDLLGNYLNETTMKSHLGDYNNQGVWVLQKK